MEAKRDQNYVPTILAVSSDDENATVVLLADPSTGRLLVDVSGGMGTSEVDNSIFTANESLGSPIMGFVTATTVSSGNIGAVGMDTDRNLKISIEADNVGIGGGVEYQEDAAHSSGATGKLALAVRNDAGGSLSDTDGDYSVLQVNANGKLYTIEENSTAILEDTANIDANVATLAGAVDGTSMVVVGNIASNSADSGNPIKIGGVYNSTLPTLDDGDRGDIQLDSRGRMITQDVGINTALDGSELQVDIVAPLPAGSNQIGKVQSVGDVAHDTADSGNPIKIGARATNSIEGQTQVANADRTDMVADLNGVLITRPHTTLEEIISERVANTDGAPTAFSNFGAGGATIHNYLTTISIYNASATDGYVDFRDGTGGAVVFTMAAPTLGGSIVNLPVPLKFAVNTAIAYDVSGALTTVYISVVGFQAQG